MTKRRAKKLAVMIWKRLVEMSKKEKGFSFLSIYAAKRCVAVQLNSEKKISDRELDELDEVNYCPLCAYFYKKNVSYNRCFGCPLGNCGEGSLFSSASPGDTESLENVLKRIKKWRVLL